MKPTTAKDCIAHWKSLHEQVKNNPLPPPSSSLFALPICIKQHSHEKSSLMNNNNNNNNVFIEIVHDDNNNINNKNNDEDDDPFDCSDLIIPPTVELVQKEIQHRMQKWRELDSRIVVQDPEENVNISTEEAEANKLPKGRGSHHKKARVTFAIDSEDDSGDVDDDDDDDDMNNVENERNNTNEDADDDDDHDEINENQNLGSGDYAGLTWGWHANRIRLPDFFDYECKGEQPQPPPTLEIDNDDEAGGQEEKCSRRRQVISLDDPTIRLDYESELWKIFKDTPLAKDIEQDAVQGSICKNTIRVKNEIQDGLKEYTRLDAHSLSRLRKRDRHHWPRVVVNQSQQQDSRNGISGATIRIECWRKQMKRGSGSDPYRCELEFLDSQTLQDMHNIIVECSQDELFNHGMQSSQELETRRSNSNGKKLQSSGFFFIEDTFYTTGEVDYVSFILQWLDDEVTIDLKKKAPSDDTKKKRKYTKKTPPPVIRSRREFLGIKKDIELKVVPMKDTKLSDIVFRVAYRYVHVFNGDCESAIFFSDVSLRMSNENVSDSQYPLIHDIFTTTTSTSTVQESSNCQGCDHGPAMLMMLDDELCDGGPTLLCSLCYAKIHYNEDGTELRYNNFRVVPLSILQNLRDLSVGNDVTDAIF